MWRVLMGVMLALPLPWWWASTENASDRETLQVALAMAGLDHAELPITLASVTPPSASRGIEAWTSYDAARVGRFVCASASFGSLRFWFMKRGTSNMDQTKKTPTRCRSRFF